MQPTQRIAIEPAGAKFEQLRHTKSGSEPGLAALHLPEGYGLIAPKPARSFRRHNEQEAEPENRDQSQEGQQRQPQLSPLPTPTQRVASPGAQSKGKFRQRNRLRHR